MGNEMKNYRIFNIMGKIRATQNHITAIGYAVNSYGVSKEHTVRRDVEPMEQFLPDESAEVLFTAMVIPGEKPEVFIQNLSRRIGGPDLMSEPVVRKVIHEIVNKFKTET